MHNAQRSVQIVETSTSLPSVFTARPEARARMRDFFSSHIRNPNTRRAYMEAVRQFSAFCAEHGIVNLRGRSGELTGNFLLQSDVWRMIRRRALAAGIKTEIGCHTFRATGITAYLKNGGRLEIAQQMAAHESARTTGLYDRRSDEVSLDEVERIGI